MQSFSVVLDLVTMVSRSLGVFLCVVGALNVF